MVFFGVRYVVTVLWVPIDGQDHCNFYAKNIFQPEKCVQVAYFTVFKNVILTFCYVLGVDGINIDIGTREDNRMQ